MEKAKKTSTKSVQEYHNKMKQNGFKLVQIWAHPDDIVDIKDFAEMKKRKRK